MAFFKRPAKEEKEKPIPRRILVADDDPNILQLIAKTLHDSRYLYETVLVKDGLEAMKAFEKQPFDLILLDVTMPFIDGFQACRRIRECSDVPIVILTARSGPEDIVHGFDLGADDYITKPFRNEILNARIGAILRRVEGYRRQMAPTVVQLKNLTLDQPHHVVTVREQEVSLTPIEFGLLFFLAANAGQVFDRETLFKEVWGYEHLGEANLVDVCVHRLREKIELKSSQPQIILTVRGVGYKVVNQ